MINIESIVGIHGVPRSGTSWLGQIFNSHPDVAFRFQPLFSYAFKSYLNLDSTRPDMDEFFQKILRTEDSFINMKDPEIHKSYPTFEKNKLSRYLVYKEVRYHHLIPHILKTHSVPRFILIVRNPYAVLNSWARAPREFKPEWDFRKEWRKAELKNMGRSEEYFGYDKWKETSHIFLRSKKEFPDRVFILSYKDLLEDTLSVTEELMNFAGIKMGDHTKNFIDKSRTKNDADPNSVFKKKDDDSQWKNFIPEDIVHFIHEDLKNTELFSYLY